MFESVQTSKVSHVFGQKGIWIPKTEHVWKPNNPKEMNAFPTHTAQDRNSTTALCHTLYNTVLPLCDVLAQK